jgi:phosphoglycerate dehydrogenase-like enzyme
MAEREAQALPLVVALNCLEDCRLEQDALAGIAEVRHVGLTQVTEGKIESATAVLTSSLAYLPGAAQRRLKPWQLILCLSCVDKAVDSALASELGLQLIHVDSKRVEEVADTTLALVLGLLRHTHVLARKGHASAAGWLGTTQSVCTGMRRCKGLVLGIIGASPTACAVAVRSLAFRMVVVYFDPEVMAPLPPLPARPALELGHLRPHFFSNPPSLRAHAHNAVSRFCGNAQNVEGQQGGKRRLPVAAKKVNSLKELLASSDIVSLHCALANDTVQLINAESLELMKQGTPCRPRLNQNHVS